MSLPSDLLVRCPPKPIGYSYRTRLLKGEYIADCVEVARLTELPKNANSVSRNLVSVAGKCLAVGVLWLDRRASYK